MHSSIALAREFLSLSAPIPVSHMKLQKLVYLAYGWWLVDHPTPLSWEPPCVFPHGPVFPVLYERLHQTRNVPLVLDALPDGEYLRPDVKAMIAWIWGRYGQLSAMELSSLAHDNSTPWKEEAAAWDFRVPVHTPIPVDRLRTFFQDIQAES